MFSSKDCECQFCNSKATSKLLQNSDYRMIDCPLCGKYIDNYFFDEIDNKNIISTFLFYNKKSDKEFNYLGDDRYYDFLKKNAHSATIFKITPEIINTYKYMTFTEKVNYIILYLGNKSRYMGDVLQIPVNEFISATFTIRFKKDGKKYEDADIRQQIHTILQYLNDSGLVDSCSDAGDNIFLMVSTKGWQLIDGLQKSTAFGKKVFIAMSYAKGTESTREALKTGISKAGYTPILIDEVTHNHQIVPEMFKQIRDSKFLVIDVSVPNNGAYYEAGYALGQGKEVIFCCKKETFEDKDNRPHFDVSQKQMIVWENENELSEKLEKWIKSLFE